MGRSPRATAAMRGVRNPCFSTRLRDVNTASNSFAVKTASDVSVLSASSSARTRAMPSCSIADRSLSDHFACLSLTVLPIPEAAVLLTGRGGGAPAVCAERLHQSSEILF